VEHLVNQDLAEHLVNQDLAEHLVNQDLAEHLVNQDRQVVRVLAGFQQDKFITLINRFQLESVHIKSYQLIQAVQLNKQFLKPQLALPQS
jgi:hypothetical protein